MQPVQINDIIDMVAGMRKDAATRRAYEIASLYTFNGDEILRGNTFGWSSRVRSAMESRNVVGARQS